MFNLIRNEWMKLFSRPATYVMVGLVVLAVIAATAITLFINSLGDGGTGSWESQLEAQNAQLEESAASGEPAFMVQDPAEQIAINEYAIENDIAPNNAGTFWSYLESSTFLISLIGLFAIIVASGIVAGEFSWGTIKLLMIRPIARWKILLSKFITVGAFGLFLVAITAILSVILGLILFDPGSSIRLVFEDGQVVEKSMAAYIVRVYLFNSLDVIMLTTMAFMISAVFRNSSLAIGISLFLLFVGGTATSFIAMYYDWAKYSLFANTNLSLYEMNMPMVEGMTMQFSIIMILIYFTIFMVLAFTIFTKRDIAS
ncbi:ABC transporter permease [Jeotgalibacillus haloalkalitolerans]|uniref:ABC transporter permease subunit n=1 Tax=Jeotgalibacillus haloalkalitolerans TaxID=3104292 RepID=A0ABU5KME9_9BACL|nr:ABC transporter permease subunit [Jeotgalibacillus sp. HH7-29]MDZ5712319.1 ABC transporter permease subunit [Jeotgalibacillus sp. HH7-29]